MTSVNEYRVYCNVETAYFTVWSVTTPTVCPNNAAHSIDTNLTTIIQTVSSNNTKITNLSKNAFDSLETHQTVPLLRVNFNYTLPFQAVQSTITGSGTTGVLNQMGIVSTGAATTSSAKVHTLSNFRTREGQGIFFRFSAIFSPGVAGNTQKIGAYDTSDGFGFGFNGTDFGIFVINKTVITWITQDNWNLDKLDGTGNSALTIDFGLGKGNIFQIKHTFTGFGEIDFFVQNPGTFEPVLVHKINYTNVNTAPYFFSPSFPMAFDTENTTNNTDIILQSSSISCFNIGKFNIVGSEFFMTWDMSVGNGVPTFCFAIRFMTTFNGIPNKSIYFAKRVITTTGTTDKPQILKGWKNPTFTGGTWTQLLPTQSTVEYLSGGTWNGDGYLVVQVNVSGKGDVYQKEFPLFMDGYVGNPGEILLFTIEGIGGTGSNIGSFYWIEDN